MTDRPHAMLARGNFSTVDHEALAEALLDGRLTGDGLNAAVSLHHHDGVPISECITANRNNCGATMAEMKAAVWEVMGGSLPPALVDDPDTTKMTMWATGQVMSKLRGGANPKTVGEMVKMRLHVAGMCRYPPNSPTEG